MQLLTTVPSLGPGIIFTGCNNKGKGDPHVTHAHGMWMYVPGLSRS